MKVHELIDYLGRFDSTKEVFCFKEKGYKGQLHIVIVPLQEKYIDEDKSCILIGGILNEEI